jgi:biopolymer transport protein ExbB
MTLTTATSLAFPVFVQGLALSLGLIVAIPALIFWRYFRARVDEYLLTLELAAERLARHLNTLHK